MHIWIWTVRIKTDGLGAKQSLQPRNGTSSLAVSHEANSHICPNEEFSSSLHHLHQVLLRRPRQWHLNTQLFRYLGHLRSQVLVNNMLVDVLVEDITSRSSDNGPDICFWPTSDK